VARQDIGVQSWRCSMLELMWQCNQTLHFYLLQMYSILPDFFRHVKTTEDRAWFWIMNEVMVDILSFIAAAWDLYMWNSSTICTIIHKCLVAAQNCIRTNLHSKVTSHNSTISICLFHHHIHFCNGVRTPQTAHAWCLNIKVTYSEMIKCLPKFYYNDQIIKERDRTCNIYDTDGKCIQTLCRKTWREV
jgi:hypothetical protein